MFKNLGFSFKTVKVFCQFFSRPKTWFRATFVFLKQKFQIKKVGLSHAPILTLFLNVIKNKRINKKKENICTQVYMFLFTLKYPNIRFLSFYHFYPARGNKQPELAGTV